MKYIEKKKFSEILDKLNIEKIEFLFIANDMGKFGLIEDLNKNLSFELYYNEIFKRNENITIIFPTASLNLVNNDVLFDINNTPSFKMGALSEYLRKKEQCYRSLHPFWSLGAIGPKAKILTSNSSKNPYDENSIFAKIFENSNSYFLSLGQHPRYMLSIVHHVEYLSNVDYRFVKKFHKKYIGYDRICNEDYFELYVLNEEYRYKKRTKNKLIFDNFEKHNNLKKYFINDSEAYFFNLQNFLQISLELFKTNPYCYWS